jgi:hypothetical protein
VRGGAAHPSDRRGKQWTPEARHLIQTAATARIVSVLRGDPSLVGKTLQLALSKSKPIAAKKLADQIFSYESLSTAAVCIIERPDGAPRRSA